MCSIIGFRGGLVNVSEALRGDGKRGIGNGLYDLVDDAAAVVDDYARDKGL